jgi:hypothetical protein
MSLAKNFQMSKSITLITNHLSTYPHYFEIRTNTLIEHQLAGSYRFEYKAELAGGKTAVDMVAILVVAGSPKVMAAAVIRV